MRALTLALFMALPQSLAAETGSFGAKGAMSCTVTSMKIISSEEGKPKTYTGFENHLTQGDTVIIDYNSSESGGFYIGLTDLKRDEAIATAYMEPDTQKNLNDDGSQVSFKGTYSDVTFGQDYISISSLVMGIVRLKRYYKGDWHGIYFRSPPFDDLKIHVFTIDCRTVDDEIDTILGFLGSDN